MSNRVHRGVSQIFGTLHDVRQGRINSSASFAAFVSSRVYHERISDTLQLLAAFPKTHLPVSHRRKGASKAQKKVGLAAAERPNHAL